MNILQVNSSDGRGGAAMVALNLHLAYKQRGHHAEMAVGFKQSGLADISILPNARHAAHRWARFWWQVYARLLPYYGRFRGMPYRLNQLIHGLAVPQKLAEDWQGIENFDFPATRHIISDRTARPAVLHLHNLHRNYFDLRALPALSQQVPTFITLHDMWLLTGHCAHAFDCERWTIGCGSCPDLSIYPAIRRDATAMNWRRKASIFERSKLYVTTPSRWLMDKVQRSLMAPGIVEARVIRNGVDLTVFRSGDKGAARAKVNLPVDGLIVLVAANGIRRSPWKDYHTMRTAIGRVAERLAPQNILFIALGDAGPEERIGLATIRFVPYVTDRQAVAAYYQAADLYLHVSRADVFSLAVSEALSCGTPVVATAVGGIPEVVQSLTDHPAGGGEPTGILTPPGDGETLANAIEELLKNPELRSQLGQNGLRESRRQLDFEQQVDAYLDWYAQILQQRKAEKAKSHD